MTLCIYKRGILLKILEDILNFIYPKRCVLCGEVLQFKSTTLLCRLCTKMNEDLEIICIKSKEETDVEDLDCFDSGYSIYEYTDVKKGIENFKFKGCKINGKELSNLMFANAISKMPCIFEDADIIAAVPMYYKKEKFRGFNQAQILADELSQKNQIPVSEGNLIRYRKTKPQSSLHDKERLENIKDSFFVKDVDEIKGKRILLIDDIHTTGATLNECSKVLKKAGAKSVDVFTLSATKLKITD